MKFSKYLMMAGAAAMLTACSSEEPIVGPDQIVDPTEIEGYAYFNLSMPSSGTRAAGDPTFDNGDESEYKVKNGKILIFGLPTTADISKVAGRVEAKYITDAEFDFTKIEDYTGTQNLSSQATKVLAKIKKGTFSESNYQAFYGVVILNYNEDETVATNKWDPAYGVTFKDWAENQTLAGQLVDEDGYFVMTNAPLYNGYTYGENNTAVAGPVVLTKINTDFVKDTEEELKKLNNSAATFYVQRVAAKVTLANALTNGTTTFTAPATIKGADNKDVANVYAGATTTITGWAMDCTRKTAYPVQNVWGDNVKEFFTSGAKAWFHSGNPERCHWADSKIYQLQGNKAMSLDECNRNFNWLGANHTYTMASEEYIRPNTMAYNQMTKGQTTRMIIKAKFTPKDGTENTTLIKFKNVANLYTEASLKAKVAEVAKEVAKIDDAEVTVNAASAGWKKFADVISVAGATPDQLAAIAEGMGIYTYTDAEIAVYYKGVCYYPVYVRHFADAQEAANVKVTPGLTVSIYNKEHTGRYGIVRNNWYDLTVTKIAGPGLPSVPDPDPTKPVDEIEDDATRYMNVDINILNWAKRSQNVEL